MKVIPCGHRIVVKREESDIAKRARQSNLFIAEVELKRENNAVDVGIVESIGPTAFKDFGGNPWCKVGDKIAFAKYAGKVVGTELDPRIVLNDEDVVCVLETDND